MVDSYIHTEEKGSLKPTKMSGGDTLIFSAYVGSDPASTVYPK